MSDAQIAILATKTKADQQAATFQLDGYVNVFVIGPLDSIAVGESDFTGWLVIATNNKILVPGKMP